MKTSKVYLYLTGTIFGICTIAMVYILISLFQTIDRGGVQVTNDVRLSPVITHVQESIRQAKTADDVKKALKSMESLSGLGSGHDLIDKFRKNYQTVVTHFQEKPKESENTVIVSRKKELVDNALNFYRKEVPHGDISLRQILLNIIFDTHASYLNESPEMEMAFSKRTKEKLTSLKALSGQSTEPGQAYRVAMLEAAYNQYEKALNLSWTWNTEKEDLLGKAEKASEKMVRDVKSNADSSLESSRREFLYSVLIGALAIFLSLCGIYFGHYYFNASFKKKSEKFLQFLRKFGMENEDAAVKKGVEDLQQDEEWAGVVQAVREAEDKFVTACQVQLSLSRNLSIPFYLFNKEGAMQLCNQAGQQLLKLTDVEVNTFTLDSFLHERVFYTGEDNGTDLDYIKNFCRENTSGVLETKLRNGEERIPVELLISHINSGNLVGGKIIVVREIRSEIARIEKEVHRQISYAQDLVQKITHGYDIQDNDAASYVHRYSKSVQQMMQDLRNMKLKVQEREILWQNEMKALLDQVSRQRDIFTQLTQEMGLVQNGQKDLQVIIDSIYSVEETLSDEVIQIEMSLQQWMENRRRLLQDLNNHSSHLARVKGYEEGVRKNIDDLKKLVGNFAGDFADLNRFKEEARLQAINLALGVASGSPEEFSIRARAYAAELTKFCDRMRVIQESLQTLIARHPGGSLFPQLEANELDADLVTQVREEHVKLSAYLQRWKVAGEQVLGEGERAKEILQEIERKNSGLTQLNQTCLLINDQAKENLQRWS